MTAPPALAVESAAEAHARAIVAGAYATVPPDCAPQVLQDPPDLYAQLRAATFERYAVLGHAKIGRQHVFRVRYVGATTVTLHHRFGAVDGQWLVLESELVQRGGSG